MGEEALREYARWFRDPERGGGCWCPSYPPCQGDTLCPNMPPEIREEGERLWRLADPQRKQEGRTNGR